MKKRLLVVLSVLGVLAGVLFVKTTPNAPLSAMVTGITNEPDGGKLFHCLVSNQTSKGYGFCVMPQTLSNGVWATTAGDSGRFGGVKRLLAHEWIEEIVSTSHDTGLLRLHIRYVPLRTSIQFRLDRGLEKLRLPAIFDRQSWQDITTPPTNFPAR